MIVSATGHRPNKLFVTENPYQRWCLELLTAYARSAITLVREEYEVTEIISGMALGWDMAIARAAIGLDIPLIAAVPFKGQEDAWRHTQWVVDEYNLILSCAKSITIVSDGPYATWKLQKRNEWMVDHCDIMLALHDGTAGGTGNCLSYLRRKKPEVKVINVWDAWGTFRDANKQAYRTGTYMDNGGI